MGGGCRTRRLRTTACSKYSEHRERYEIVAESGSAIHDSLLTVEIDVPVNRLAPSNAEPLAPAHTNGSAELATATRYSP